MWLTNSSIGRKFVMALTGAFLILFVTFHCLMNAVAIFWPAAYNVVCAFLGANWYALIGTLVLAAGFILHIIYALWLTVENRRARGNDRYAVTSRPKEVEWASKNMLVLGIVVLAFLVVHLIQFWAKMQLQEIRGELYVAASGEPVPAAAGTWFLEIAFGHWYTLLIYAIGFIALWFHMTHGFWSMFQSAGWNNDLWIKRLKCIGNAWTTVVVGLFLAEAIVFTVMANKHAYTQCPALQVQYEEMAAEHQNALVNGEPVEMMCSDCNGTCGDCNGTCTDCNGTCGDCANCPEGCTDCKCACTDCACGQCADCAGTCADCTNPCAACPNQQPCQPNE